MKKNNKKTLSTAVSYLLILAGAAVVFSMIFGLTVEYNPIAPDGDVVYNSVNSIGIKSLILMLFLGLVKLILVWHD